MEAASGLRGGACEPGGRGHGQETVPQQVKTVPQQGKCVRYQVKSIPQ